MLSWLLAAFLAIPALSQAGSENHATFGGLDDTNAPATIDPSKCQSCLNVETNPIGSAIFKRDGFTRQFSLIYTTAPVNGSFSFIDVNGNRQDIVCHDRYCQKMTNGSAPVTFISSGGVSGSGSVPLRWSFATTQGHLYGANDARDPPFDYDGTTLLYPSTIPKGAIVEMSKDRLIVSDVSTSPNSVYYSQSGTYTNFTTGINSADPYVDNLGSSGERVTAVKYDRGRLFVFKTQSFQTCLLGDQYTSYCRVISNNIGTYDPLAVVSAPDGLYFRGSDRNYWKWTEQNGLELLSRYISTLTQSQSVGAVQSNTQDLQADWQAGTQAPLLSWNTTTMPGSIFPSSGSFVDTSASSYAQGYLNSVSTTNTSVVIAVTSAAVPGSNFEASPSVWTNYSDIANNYYVSTGATDGQSINFGHGPFTVNCPNHSATCAVLAHWAFASCPQGVGFPFLTLYDGKTGSILKKDSSIAFNGGPQLNAATQINDVEVSSTVVVCLSDAGQFCDFGSGFFSSVKRTITDPIGWNIIWDASLQNSNTQTTGCLGYTSISNVRISSYPASSSYVSRTFDTTYTTPTLSGFNIGQSSTPAHYTIAYKEAASADQITWSTTTINPSARAISQKRYWRYEDDFTTDNGTTTPVFFGANLYAATTGQYVSQCIQPGPNIGSWGYLVCGEQTSGSGSLIIASTSAASCAALPTSTGAWTTSSNGATLSIATNTAFAFRITSLLTSATDQAQVDNCTVYWNNGIQAPPSWGIYHSVKNAIYWTISVNQSATNNRLLKLDLNRNEWFPFDIAANAPRFINTSLYFGSAGGGYWNLYGNGVGSDNGSAINSYWQSKDFGGDSPFLQKSWKRISFLARNTGSSSLNITWSIDNNRNGTYSVNLATTTTIPYIHSNANLTTQSPASFINVKFGNNAINQPWEIDGYGIDYFAQPWQVQSQ